jgi:hypothetical protein
LLLPISRTPVNPANHVSRIGFLSRGGCSTTEEMKEEHHDTDYEQNMN